MTENDWKDAWQHKVDFIDCLEQERRALRWQLQHARAEIKRLEARLLATTAAGAPPPTGTKPPSPGGTPRE